MMIAAVSNGNSGMQEWLIDTGATCHIPFDCDNFIQFTEETRSIATANGTKITIQGTGMVELKLGSLNDGVKIWLQDVYSVPGLKSRIISEC
jgi:hypothetical protein